MAGLVHSLSVSDTKGVPKINTDTVVLQENWGIVGDAHAGDWHRQISLLSYESIEKMIALGADVKAGIFAENITTQGIPLTELHIGARLQIGSTVLEITQIGKECHTRCAIYYQVGDCVMPREGIFAKVLQGGSVNVGDEITQLIYMNN